MNAPVRFADPAQPRHDWTREEIAALAGLLGGTLAATSHVAKANTRAAVNEACEPVSRLSR